MKTIKVKSAIIFLLIFLTNNTYSQNYWEEGVINTKSGQFKCSYSKNTSGLSIKKIVNDERASLPLGCNDNASTKVYINSAKEINLILTETFGDARLKELLKISEKFDMLFTLDKDGAPIQMTFRLNSNTTMTPEELSLIDERIKVKVRFKVVRDIPCSSPHTNMFFLRIKFDEVLSGEIKSLKENEEEGKRYW